MLLLALCIVLSAVSAQKQVKLVIAGRDGDYGNAMQVAVDAYTAKNPNVKFDVLKLSGDDVYQKTVIDLKSGTGTYDLILIDDPKALQYQQAGWLTDLDAMFKKTGKTLDSDFIPTVIDLCRYPNNAKGKLYSLPFVGNVSLFAYRADLFAKYKLPAPETWDDVLVAVKTISEKETGVDGVSFRGVKGNPILTAFLTILWSFCAWMNNSSSPFLSHRQFTGSGEGAQVLPRACQIWPQEYADEQHRPGARWSACWDSRSSARSLASLAWKDR
jgi:multiple sugar transport system substrate-binding protein